MPSRSHLEPWGTPGHLELGQKINVISFTKSYHSALTDKVSFPEVQIRNIARGTTDPGHWVHNSNHPPRQIRGYKKKKHYFLSFVKILKSKKEVKESSPCQQCWLNNQHASAVWMIWVMDSKPRVHVPLAMFFSSTMVIFFLLQGTIAITAEPLATMIFRCFSKYWIHWFKPWKKRFLDFLNSPTIFKSVYCLGYFGSWMFFLSLLKIQMLVALQFVEQFELKGKFKISKSLNSFRKTIIIE